MTDNKCESDQNIKVSKMPFLSKAKPRCADTTSDILLYPVEKEIQEIIFVS